MYGYMNDIHLSLNQDEMQVYKTYYCRVCNALSLRYGYSYRALVNYDVVVYMIITKLAIGDSFACHHYRCQALHLRGRKDFLADELGQFFAALTARGMSVAVEDKVQDGEKKYKFFALLFSKAFKPHDQKEKQLYEKVADRMQELLALERSGSREVDLYLNYYADSILLCIDEYYPQVAPAYRELIFQIARFADYMDMLQDYDDDQKEGAFNPLICADSPTFHEYLGRHWQSIHAVTAEMCRQMNRALHSIRPAVTASPEWEILAKIVKLVIPRAICKVISGQSKRTSFLPTD